MSEMRVRGLHELQERFRQLPKEITAKVLRKGVAAGARLVRDAARAGAPIAAQAVNRGRGVLTQPGTLRRAAIIKFIRENSTDTQVEYIVTFRQGKRAARIGKDAFYAKFIEFGHRTRNGGLVAPRRFLGPALALNVDRVIEVMTTTMKDELAKLPDFQ